MSAGRRAGVDKREAGEAGRRQWVLEEEQEESETGEAGRRE
jgi:hypothetical protein